MTIQEYKAKLKRDIPKLAVDSIRILGKGWYYDAVEVNESIILRIPHHTYSRHITPKMVRAEIELLELLKNRLPVEIPDPKYVAPDDSYFGYPKLSGVILHEILDSFTNVEWEQYKADWVDVASAIHTRVSIETAKAAGVPNLLKPDPSKVEQLFDLPEADHEVIDFAKKTMQQYKEHNTVSSSRFFLHSDLQSKNILVDPETKRISGLIDWTDARIGQLPREFSIHEWMQGSLLKEVAALYEAKTRVKVDIAQARIEYSLDELGAYIYALKAKQVDDAAESLNRLKLLASVQ